VGVVIVRRTDVLEIILRRMNMSDKLYNGCKPINTNLFTNDKGMRVHNQNEPSMAAELHKRLKEKLAKETK
jgi:hypothetical protein